MADANKSETYVVHDYDHVSYAGTDWLEAIKHLRGSMTVQVWENNKFKGDLDIDGNWL